MKSAKSWPLLLLIIPFVFGWLGYTGHGFLFKALVAGSGILFLLFFYNKDLCIKKDVWCIITAFAFSIVGDWFLSTRNGDSMKFIYGIIFFFLAHAGYLCYSLWNGRIKWFFTFILLTTYLVFFLVFLYPSIRVIMLLVTVWAYIIISCFSLGAAAGLRLLPVQKWVYFSGITLILFSDTIIALSEFTSYKDLNFLILPTYYLAQISVIMALMINKLNSSHIRSESE